MDGTIKIIFLSNEFNFTVEKSLFAAVFWLNTWTFSYTEYLHFKSLFIQNSLEMFYLLESIVVDCISLFPENSNSLSEQISIKDNLKIQKIKFY